MTETKHTPGSWRVLWGRNASYPLTIHNGTVNIVTSMGRKAHPEAIANARLIAAAPELLAALKRTLAELESHIRNEYEGTSMFVPMMAELQPVHELIAKATGSAA